MIVVTGMSGSGKTTLLKKSKLKNVHYLDKVVKKLFYKRKCKLYWDIKETFGKNVVSLFKVKTNKLGEIVLQDKDKLEILNDLVEPYIKTYLNILKLDLETTHIIEMATFMNLESKYGDFFDKVIIIKRSVNDIDNKFKYLKEKTNPIKYKKIKNATVIKNDDIDVATKELIKLIVE